MQIGIFAALEHFSLSYIPLTQRRNQACALAEEISGSAWVMAWSRAIAVRALT